MAGKWGSIVLVCGVYWGDKCHNLTRCTISSTMDDHTPGHCITDKMGHSCTVSGHLYSLWTTFIIDTVMYSMLPQHSARNHCTSPLTDCLMKLYNIDSTIPIAFTNVYIITIIGNLALTWLMWIYLPPNLFEVWHCALAMSDAPMKHSTDVLRWYERISKHLVFYVF